MGDQLTLALGEERAVHLPPGEWSFDVQGMASAVDVRKLWPADPYPDDDEEDDGQARQPPDVVFMIRGTCPGSATIRFAAGGGSLRAAAKSRHVEVTVRS